MIVRIVTDAGTFVKRGRIRPDTLLEVGKRLAIAARSSHEVRRLALAATNGDYVDKICRGLTTLITLLTMKSINS